MSFSLKENRSLGFFLREWEKEGAQDHTCEGVELVYTDAGRLISEPFVPSEIRIK